MPIILYALGRRFIDNQHSLLLWESKRILLRRSYVLYDTQWVMLAIFSAHVKAISKFVLVVCCLFLFQFVVGDWTFFLFGDNVQGFLFASMQLDFCQLTLFSLLLHLIKWIVCSVFRVCPPEILLVEMQSNCKFYENVYLLNRICVLFWAI